MSSIEVLATIFAVLVLLKVLIYIFNPGLRVRIAEALLKDNFIVTFVYLVLVAVVGYFIFSNFNIIEVSALLLFASLLIGLGFLPFSKEMIRLAKEVLKSKENLVSKTWFILLIYVVLALWTLYAVFR